MDSTIAYATQELKQYLQQITRSEVCKITLAVEAQCCDTAVGTDFDPEWDDAYIIDVQKGCGKITGVNARSVLLGVYKFLSLLGCCFYRPTKHGEFICRRAYDDCSVKHSGIASYRHRGICIEGAVSLENVLDMIEWAPKVGFNAYFLQFRDAHTFFERWYTHEGNEFLEKEDYTRENSAAFVNTILNEIKKRGMLYHAVGHGWTCECLGFPSMGWHKVKDEEIPQDQRGFLAMIGGKRTFFEGIPLNTQLCYSNEAVRKILVDEVVEYAQAHPEIDILHFWLADNFNNFCECEECRKRNPPDHYVALLNEIDAQFTRRNIDKKIVFLIYFELLWTPEQEKLINTDRFIMMFAPISRTYTRTFLENGKAPDLAHMKRMPYIFNQVKYPSDVKENLVFLHEWQKVFDRDSFDFDYHMMWDIYRDYGGMRLSRVIYEDIVGLQEIGLNGLVSCQLQRSFFPSSWSMYVMGNTLFDRNISYEALMEEHFRAAYGEYAVLAKDFLNGLSDFFSHEYARSEIPMLNPEMAERFENAHSFITTALPRLQRAETQLADVNQKKMMRFLVVAGDIFAELALILRDKAEGVHLDECKKQWELLKNRICHMENEVQPVLDVMYFNMLIGGLVTAEW